jgi:tetratricopeptide (TPR) repeat protein
MSEPLSPLDPDSSLAEVRALYEQRDWTALAERFSRTQAESPETDPEIAFCYADALWRVGQAERSLDLVEPIRTAARLRGDRRLQLNVINVTGMAFFRIGRISDAEVSFSELLELASEWNDEEYAARASNNLGVLANVRSRRDLALTYYQRALASYYRIGYQRGLAQTHNNLGISYRDLGFDREADAHYQRAIGFARSANSEDVIALAENERALLRARCGDGPAAEALAQRAMQRFERMGDDTGRAEALRVLASAARAQGRDELAADRLDQALAIARDHSDPLLRAEIQRDRGLLLRDQGQPDAAREALLDAADHFAVLGAPAEAEAVRAILSDLDRESASPPPPS